MEEERRRGGNGKGMGGREAKISEAKISEAKISEAKFPKNKFPKNRFRKTKIRRKKFEEKNSKKKSKSLVQDRLELAIQGLPTSRATLDGQLKPSKIDLSWPSRVVPQAGLRIIPSGKLKKQHM